MGQCWSALGKWLRFHILYWKDNLEYEYFRLSNVSKEDDHCLLEMVCRHYNNIHIHFCQHGEDYIRILNRISSTNLAEKPLPDLSIFFVGWKRKVLDWITAAVMMKLVETFLEVLVPVNHFALLANFSNNLIILVQKQGTMTSFRPEDKGKL